MAQAAKRGNVKRPAVIVVMVVFSLFSTDAFILIGPLNLPSINCASNGIPGRSAFGMTSDIGKMQLVSKRLSFSGLTPFFACKLDHGATLFSL